MRFWIRHDSLYRYDVPVSLGPHLLRLSPRVTLGNVRILERRLHIEPEPVSRWDEQDEHGNTITRVSFAGSTSVLRALSELTLETLPEAPLLVPRQSAPLPWPSAAAAPVDPSVQHFAESLARDVQGEPVAFLDHATRTLFTSFDRRIRPSGAARPAAETLALREGACRDLTVLFLDACRHLGLSGRFVSGYQAQAETPDGLRHLHAWTEVYLPGTGWCGWDATHGVRAGDGHVALCAAPEQTGTMPIEGGFSFQGPVVNSTLDCSVHIRTARAALQ
jgi:transglutaminase-like putative cysteine protease